MDHPAQPQIGAIILGAGAFDHFEHGNSRKSTQHRGKLGWCSLIGDSDQCGAGAIKHAERAVAGDAARQSKRRDRLNPAFTTAVRCQFLDLNRLMDAFLCGYGSGEEGAKRKEDRGQEAHSSCLRPAALLQCQRQGLRPPYLHRCSTGARGFAITSGGR